MRVRELLYVIGQETKSHLTFYDANGNKIVPKTTEEWENFLKMKVDMIVPTGYLEMEVWIR